MGAMAMKGCSAFPKAPGLLEPNHQNVYCHIQDTHWWGDSYPSAEIQSLYSTALVDWVIIAGRRTDKFMSLARKLARIETQTAESRV